MDNKAEDIGEFNARWGDVPATENIIIIIMILMLNLRSNESILTAV